MIITVSHSKMTEKEAAEARGLGDLRKYQQKGHINLVQHLLCVFFEAHICASDF